MDKQYKCSECKELSSSYAWNQETTLYFGTHMHSINSHGKDSDTFICPECGEEQPRHMIVEVTND
ncbi:MAG: hypothetical protein ACQEXX_01145 [Bacillota bacterium]